LCRWNGSGRNRNRRQGKRAIRVRGEWTDHAGNPSMSGGSGLENQYVINGVNVTNQGYGALGSYSIVFGSLGNATPFDFIKDVQVKTGGYEAEFGQSTGGVVNRHHEERQQCDQRIGVLLRSSEWP